MADVRQAIVGGGAAFTMLGLVGNHVWQRTEDAYQLAMENDARQQKLEALVEQQNEYNRRLLELLEKAQLTPTPERR